jgi:hypothetical protein
VLQIDAGDEIRTKFEHITAACLRGFGGIQVEHLGAPYPGQDIKGFRNRVEKLAESFALKVNEEELRRFSHPHEKDRGLDLVARVWRNDPSGGMPYLFVQCATGRRWIHDKAAEPPLDAWNKFATWDGPSLKTIAVPYTVSRPRGLGDAWLRTSNSIIFDRIRLSKGNPDDFLDAKTKENLSGWCRKQILKFEN